MERTERETHEETVLDPDAEQPVTHRRTERTEQETERKDDGDRDDEQEQ